MDILEKEKKDQLTIRVIFLLLPLLLGVVGAFTLNKLNYLPNETFLGEIILLGLMLTSFSFVFMCVIVYTWCLSTLDVDKYIIIEHTECGKKYYTVHTIIMWGKLVWELEPIGVASYDKTPKKFDRKASAMKHIEDLKKDEIARMESYRCEQNATKKIVDRL